MGFEYENIKEEILSLRREIHMYPELAFDEYETAKRICRILDKYQIPYINGIAKTGIVATVGTKNDKVLLIRADIDALPISEKTNLSFASKNEGVMHACGHDIHIASVLAIALLLKKHENQLNGSVKFVFQPAEEGVGGALPMIEEGILDNPKVTCAIAGHIDPKLETGKIKIKSGPLMASPDDFAIKYIGKSTHGAEPQNGINPIPAVAEMALKLGELAKKLSKGINVLSVCTVMADGSVNIIPEEAIIKGTFRSFSEENRKEACDLIKAVSEEIAHKYNVKLEYEYHFLYPPVINEENTTKELISVSECVLGKENVILMDKPLMTGEDFAYFCKYAPSALVWYGAKSDNYDFPLHSANMVANEDAIEVCTRIFFEFAMNYLD